MDSETRNGVWARICLPFENCSDSARELRYMLILAVASAVFCAVVQLSGVHSSVIEGYFPYADAMFRGIAPYTDTVFVYGGYNVWEYPPLAYAVLFVPRLFSDNPYGYHIAYIVMMLLVIWIGMNSAGKIARILGRSHFVITTMYTAFTLLLLEFVLDRFDMVVVVICIVAIRFLLEGKYPVAAVMISLGMLMKLYPVILAPIFAVYLLSEGKRHELFRAVAAFLAVCVIVIPFAAVGDLTQMFDYHGNRPLEIECFFASVLNVVACIFPESGMTWIYSYGSDNIVGWIADWLGRIAVPLMVLMIISTYALYAYGCIRNPHAGFDGVTVASFIAVCCFIMFGSVFSGQYVLWLLPFVLPLMAASGEEFAFRDRRFRLFTAVCVLTQLDFLLNFGMRPEGGPLFLAGALTILARNLILLWLMADVAKDIVQTRGCGKEMPGSGAAD